MADVSRIDVHEARRKVAAGEAVLVCGYTDEAKCSRIRLDGSITMSQLASRLPSLSRDQPIIFYCA